MSVKRKNSVKSRSKNPQEKVLKVLLKNYKKGSITKNNLHKSSKLPLSSVLNVIKRLGPEVVSIRKGSRNSDLCRLNESGILYKFNPWELKKYFSNEEMLQLVLKIDPNAEQTLAPLVRIPKFMLDAHPKLEMLGFWALSELIVRLNYANDRPELKFDVIKNELTRRSFWEYESLIMEILRLLQEVSPMDKTIPSKEKLDALANWYTELKRPLEAVIELNDIFETHLQEIKKARDSALLASSSLVSQP